MWQDWSLSGESQKLRLHCCSLTSCFGDATSGLLLTYAHVRGLISVVLVGIRDLINDNPVGVYCKHEHPVWLHLLCDTLKSVLGDFLF